MQKYIDMKYLQIMAFGLSLSLMACTSETPTRDVSENNPNPQDTTAVVDSNSVDTLVTDTTHSDSLNIPQTPGSDTIPIPFSFLNQWTATQSVDGQFHGVHCLGYSPLKRIYICDEASHRIQYFDLNGTNLGAFGQWGQGNSDMVNPVHMAFRNDGSVYIVERDNNRIHLFSAAGEHISLFGDATTFNKPAAIAIAKDGSLFITDRMNHRVVHTSAQGTVLGQFGSFGSANGQFNEPYGIAISAADILYVSDSQNNRVQYFDLQGKYLGQWGSTGSGNSMFGQTGQYNNGPEFVPFLVETGYPSY